MSRKDNTFVLGFDICKWVLAIFVIAIHTHPFERCPIDIINKINSSIVHLAVPVFFVITGYLLFTPPLSPPPPGDLPKIKTYAFNILRLYCIWTIIYMPLTIYDYIHNGRSILYDILDFVRGFFFIGEHYYSWPLWYLLSTLYALVFIFLLLKCGLSKKIIFVLAMVLFVIISINICILIPSIDRLPNLLQMVIRPFSLIFFTGRVFNGIGYIALGMFIANFDVMISKFLLILIIVIGMIARIFFNTFIATLMLPIIAGALVYLLKDWKSKNRGIGYKLRKTSAIMYFTHMIFFFLYSIWRYNDLPYYGTDAFLVSFVCTQLISIIVLYLEFLKDFSIIKKFFNF